jgi:hypothetical protein
MRSAGYSAAGLLLVFGAAPGCQRFTTQMEYQLGVGEVRRIAIDGPRSDQQVRVTISSPGQPVAAYIVLDEHADAVRNKLLAHQRPDPEQYLSGREGIEEPVVIEAKVPQKKAYAVLIGGALKSADVKVKITGS